MEQTVDVSLRAGRDAIKRHAWQDAYEHLATADASGRMSAEDLESLAEAAWCTARFQDCIDADERAYGQRLEQGNRSRAALIALWLSWFYGGSLAPAVASGWRDRAGRLLEEEPECREQGFLAYDRVSAALAQGDLDRALDQANKAFEIGKRFGDRDLQTLGLRAKGLVLLRKGDVAGGTALVDEAMAAALGGELSPLVTRMIYCGTITTYQILTDYRRAAEWLDAWEHQCEREDIAGGLGDCRGHRVEILRLRGAWLKAEQEATRACAEWSSWTVGLRHAGTGWYEIGEIRLCQGKLAGAADAFQRACQLGNDAQPGLSRLLLAEGKLEAAAASIKRALAPESLSRLARAQRLPALVEIGIASGDLEGARSASEELEDIARIYETSALEARAACARGALELVEGDAAAACRNLRRGVQLWQEVDAPYEAARVRMLLATACRAEGDEEAAILELKTARSAFDDLGAVLDGRQATELLGRSATAAAAQVGGATRTFMFTDIVKSTNLVEAIGDEAWDDLLRWHDQTLRSLFATHRGEEIDHAGDGFFVAFEAAPAAIECAVAIQRALADHRRIHGFAPQIRIGLHTAKATHKARAYKGRGVHAAARIAALAEGGRILVSTETLAAEPLFPVSNRRTVSLKGISDPVEIANIEWR